MAHLFYPGSHKEIEEAAN